MLQTSREPAFPLTILGGDRIVKAGVNDGELSKRIDDLHKRLDDLRADTNRRFEELWADMNQRFHTLTWLTSVWFSLLTLLFKYIR